MWYLVSLMVNVVILIKPSITWETGFGECLKGMTLVALTEVGGSPTVGGPIATWLAAFSPCHLDRPAMVDCALGLWGRRDSFSPGFLSP